MADKPDVPAPDAPVSVGVALRFGVTGHAEIALLITPAASAGDRTAETLQVSVDSTPLPDAAIQRIVVGGAENIVVTTPPGELRVDYRGTVHRHPGTPPVLTSDAAAAERIEALRPSRYAPADELAGFAAATFDRAGNTDDTATTATRVAAWVFEHLLYEPAASRPTGTATDTLVSSAGVCRDFAHLTVALCRALDIPARMSSVYAPGLSPMDFHAVPEVLAGGEWLVLDPTRLAPRQSLVRIATGRDAADTAFATTLSGNVSLETIEVSAVLETDRLPIDDHIEHVILR